MYNANTPKENELPTTKQLITSTLAAITVAAALLVSCVLPAEYGIDPTGLGKILGLTKMGEIKTQLATEAETGNIVEAKDIDTPKPAQITELESATVKMTTESMTLALAPGAAAEIKVQLKKGEMVSYSWNVNTGHVNFDNHGDGDSTNYHNYSKGKAATSDEGKITAAFDGSHGWYWRNRSSENVTINLSVSGEAVKLKRVL